MLKIFHRELAVFNIKEIEKKSLAAGITFQSYKDVLDSLVGDNLVETDKVGIANYWWSFPNKAFEAKKQRLASLEANIKLFVKKRSEATKRRDGKKD